MIDEEDYVMTLEQNAWDSLRHGLHHFVDDESDSDLKYAIFHTFHAVELFLKARLAKEAPALIYRETQGPFTDDSFTVNVKEAINRLKAIDVVLSEDDTADIEALRVVRISLEHHRVSVNHATVVFYVGRVMRFLEGFLQDELDISMSMSLSNDDLAKLRKARDDFELEIRVAKRLVDQRTDDDTSVLDCLECGNPTIIWPDLNTSETAWLRSGRCLMPSCASSFIVANCAKCDQPLLVTDDGNSEPYFHDYCWDYIMRE